MRGKAHDPELRAAVLSALLAGQSISSVAREYRIDRASVIAWRNAAGIGSTPVQPQKRVEIGDLLSDYLREVLGTLAVQARTFRDEAWLRKQDASEAAVLHGVLTDKAIRLLEALDPGGPEGGPDAP
jgi:transposase-like protein